MGSGEWGWEGGGFFLFFYIYCSISLAPPLPSPHIFQISNPLVRSQNARFSTSMTFVLVSLSRSIAPLQSLLYSLDRAIRPIDGDVSLVRVWSR